MGSSTQQCRQTYLHAALAAGWHWGLGCHLLHSRQGLQDASRAEQGQDTRLGASQGLHSTSRDEQGQAAGLGAGQGLQGDSRDEQEQAAGLRAGRWRHTGGRHRGRPGAQPLSLSGQLGQDV